jgi:hypothetical protein
MDYKHNHNKKKNKRMRFPSEWVIRFDEIMYFIFFVLACYFIIITFIQLVVYKHGDRPFLDDLCIYKTKKDLVTENKRR